jgi:hypothetical protein
LTGHPPPLYVSREDFGTYKVTYVNCAKASVTLVNPEDVPAYSPNTYYAMAPFVRMIGSPGLLAETVWAGCARTPAGGKEPVFLTRTTWTLPLEHRGEIVEKLELQAGSAESAPLIFAITIE